MRLLIEYVDFHCDNNQGGSGTSFQFQTVIEISESCKDIWQEIHEKMEEVVKRQRPFNVSYQSKRPAIQRVTLL